MELEVLGCSLVSHWYVWYAKKVFLIQTTDMFAGTNVKKFTPESLLICR